MCSCSSSLCCVLGWCLYEAIHVQTGICIKSSSSIFICIQSCSMADSMQPKASRARSKPNLQVSLDQYKEALHGLLVAEPPLLDMRSKLGPTLAKHQAQVTPGHLVSFEKLWYPLINNGCNQLVLQSNKIQHALQLLVHENSLLIQAGTPSIVVPCFMNDVKKKTTSWIVQL